MATLSKSAATSKSVTDLEIMIPVSNAMDTLSKEGAYKEQLPEPAKLKALSTSEADKAIGQIERSGAVMRTLIHTTACGILLHYVQHGDYTRMPFLHAAVQRAMGAAAANNLAAWVSYHSTLKYDAKNAWYFDSVKGQGKDAKKFLVSARDPSSGKMVGGAHTPFWSFEIPSARREEKPVDAREVVGKLYKRLENLLDKKLDRRNPADHITISEKFVEDFKSFCEDHGIKIDKDGNFSLVATPPLQLVESAPAKKPTATRRRKPAAKQEAPATQDESSASAE